MNHKSKKLTLYKGDKVIPWILGYNIEPDTVYTVVRTRYTYYGEQQVQLDNGEALYYHTERFIKI